MRPPGFVVGIAVVLVATGALSGESRRFDAKLANDKRALHALNRLAYGPRPGEVDDVRRLGVEAWIRRQLLPEQIPEDPRLEARLAPLSTLQMTSSQIFERAQRVARPAT